MRRKIIILLIPLLVLLGVFVFIKQVGIGSRDLLTDFPNNNMGGELVSNPHELSIDYLRGLEFPGSELTVEETLSPGSNYQRYIVSYRSEGLKIFALLTVPNGDLPVGGFPAVVFNHGYIPPAQYRTTERYVAYTDAFSRNGYVLLRPDYRGHGNSEGSATGAYGSNGYAIDVLNALGSVKRLGLSVKGEGESSENLALNAYPFPLVDPSRIGMWGHSLGGFLTLRAMVVNADIKAGVIWAGVVGSYEDLFERWRRRGVPSGTPSRRGGSWRQSLQTQFGTPDENQQFWDSLSANSYLTDVSGPIQLHHGTADSSVPVEFSEDLEIDLKSAGKTVELYTYPGDDHNISLNFNTAAQRSVEFFDRYLK